MYHAQQDVLSLFFYIPASGKELQAWSSYIEAVRTISYCWS